MVFPGADQRTPLVPTVGGGKEESEARASVSVTTVWRLSGGPRPPARRRLRSAGRDALAIACEGGASGHNDLLSAGAHEADRGTERSLTLIDAAQSQTATTEHDRPGAGSLPVTVDSEQSSPAHTHGHQVGSVRSSQDGYDGRGPESGADRGVVPIRNGLPAHVTVDAPAGPGYRREQGVLIIGDWLALILSFGAARVLGWSQIGPPARFAAALAIALLCGSTLAAVYGLYSRDLERSDHTTADDLPQIVHVAVMVTCATAIALSLGSGQISIEPLLAACAGIVLLMSTTRAIVRTIKGRRPRFRQRTVIVGAGEVGQRLAAKLISRPVHGYELVGFVDDDLPTAVDPAVADVPLLGGLDDLKDVVRRHRAERMIVAFSPHTSDRSLSLVRTLRQLNVHVDVVPRLFDAYGASASMHAIDGLPLVGMPQASYSRASHHAKRAMDIALASVGMVLFAPVFLVIAVLVKRDSPGPIFYSAERVGRHGVLFRQYKFRTMHAHLSEGSTFGGDSARAEFESLLDQQPAMRKAYERRHKLDNDPRVTRIGRTLRSTSLDELPQLLNVLRGELSLVGPRPVTEEELARYGEYVDLLLSVRPGLTGNWQVTGRSALNYDERVRLDLAYVRGWSLKLDVQILLKSSCLFTRRTRAV